MYSFTSLALVVMLAASTIAQNLLTVDSNLGETTKPTAASETDGRLSNTLTSVQIDIDGGPDARSFGSVVKVLSNGNFVVTDPLFYVNGIPVGAVFLIDGQSLQV